MSTAPRTEQQEGARLLVSAFLVVAAIIGMFGVETRDRRFEDVSP